MASPRHTIADALVLALAARRILFDFTDRSSRQLRCGYRYSPDMVHPTAPTSLVPLQLDEWTPPEPSHHERNQLRESKIPTGRMNRLFEYTNLVAGVAVGTVKKSIQQTISGKQDGTPAMASSENIERFVDTLTRMRGAALKLGQMLSIQDNDVFPPQIQELMMRFQNAADYMPTYQMEQMMRQELGSEWRTHFETFEDVPFAAASIGQVHRATLKNGDKVAVKVQYPGVAKSLISDLSNLEILLNFSQILPKGLYLDNTIRVAKKELSWETDYLREAESTKTFRKMLKNDNRFLIPKVYDHLTTKSVLTTQFMDGLPIAKLSSSPQSVRDYVGESLLELCLQELFQYRFMQTDPNWANFLYDPKRRAIVLLDFGSARSFDKEFTDNYKTLIAAAVRNDTDACIEYSKKLGFLTGDETTAMMNSHVSAMKSLAQPFLFDRFNFGDQKVSSEVKEQIPIMLKYRLTPPPDESYSLHRKLSGAFLLCTKLDARVRCRGIFQKFVIAQ